MEYKSNFNRLHYLLTEEFSNVEVTEKANSSIGSYIELNIKEDLDCKILIKKKNIESQVFIWEYFPDPNGEQTIKRTSSIDNFTSCVKDIIDNKRFSSEYLNKLK